MMAKKKNESVESEISTEQSTPTRRSATVLAEDVLFKGDFESKEPILIHGKVEGDIASTSDVSLSSQAKITGNIAASNLEVAGNVEGDIQCKGTTNITEKGTVNGMLLTKRFIMSEDSVFNGNLKINKD